jgi:hypothetical protein
MPIPVDVEVGAAVAVVAVGVTGGIPQFCSMQELPKMKLQEPAREGFYQHGNSTKESWHLVFQRL